MAVPRVVTQNSDSLSPNFDPDFLDHDQIVKTYVRLTGVNVSNEPNDQTSVKRFVGWLTCQNHS